MLQTLAEVCWKENKTVEIQAKTICKPIIIIVMQIYL